jgi:hypothetical protein
MQVLRFGLNLTISDESRQNLIKRDGVKAASELRQFEQRLQEELGQYQDLSVEVKPDTYMKNEQGLLTFQKYDTVQVGGVPTDPETGDKLPPQKADTWVIEEGETILGDVLKGVLDLSRQFVEKFNVK